MPSFYSMGGQGRVGDSLSDAEASILLLRGANEGLDMGHRVLPTMRGAGMGALSNFDAMIAPSSHSMNMITGSSAGCSSQPTLEFDADGAHHPSVVLYAEYDGDNLTEYQCLLRKQIELFEA